MNVDNLLNIEKRTGVKDADIDDFLAKADAVQAAIRGMADGTIKPDEVHVDGIDTPAELERKEKERIAAQERRKKNEEELRAKRAKEEREKWWAGADLFRTVAEDEKESSESGVVVEGGAQADAEKAAKQERIARYEADYSRWDQWQADDPATKEEAAELEAAEDKKRNETFEASNPEFCEQFKTDMKERNAKTAAKQSNANICRLRGNAFYKKADYPAALMNYTDSLKHAPYDTKTLLNIAQVHIKAKRYDDAMEFLDRTLYMNGKQAKALSRQAFVLTELGRTEEALASATKALSLEPGSADIAAQHDELQARAQDAAEERRLRETLLRKGSASAAAAVPAAPAPASAPAPAPASATSNNAAAAASVSPPPPPAPTAASTATATSGEFATVDTLLAVMQKVGSEDAEVSMAVQHCKECATFLGGSKDGRLYLRVVEVQPPASASTSNGLAYLSQLLMTQSEGQSAKWGDFTLRAALLEVILAGCADEKTSVVALHDARFTMWVRESMASVMLRYHSARAVVQGTVQEEGEKKGEMLALLSTVDSSVQLLTATFAHCLKSRASLVGDERWLLGALKLHAYKALTLIQQQGGEEGKKGSSYKLSDAETSALLGGVLRILQYLKLVLFSPEGKKFIRDGPTAAPGASKAASASSSGSGESYLSSVLLVGYVLHCCGDLYGRHRAAVVAKAVAEATGGKGKPSGDSTLELERQFALSQLCVEVMEFSVDVLVGLSQFGGGASSGAASSASATADAATAQRLREFFTQQFDRPTLLASITKATGVTAAASHAKGGTLAALAEACSVDAAAMAQAAAAAAGVPSKKTQTATMNAVSGLLSARTHIPNYECNILAVLMNITIEGGAAAAPGSTSVRDVLCERNPAVVDLALSVLQGSKGQSVPQQDAAYAAMMDATKVDGAGDADGGAGGDAVLHIRKLGLLSRLVTNAGVLRRFLDDSDAGTALYTSACHYLARCIRYHYPPPPVPVPIGKAKAITAAPAPFVKVCTSPAYLRYRTEELNHAVRVFATIAPAVNIANTAIISTQRQQLYQRVAVQEGVFTAIVGRIFPTPRTELGEFTANSVIQTPKEFIPTSAEEAAASNSIPNTSASIAATSLLIGNAARILLSFADSATVSAEVFGDSSLAGVQRFVCAMATCTDIRVRKNIAILLAKGCRYSTATKELVTKLRGVQMMVELQDKLK